jgi:hypothetical protein
MSRILWSPSLTTSSYFLGEVAPTTSAPISEATNHSLSGTKRLLEIMTIRATTYAYHLEVRFVARAPPTQSVVEYTQYLCPDTEV